MHENYSASPRPELEAYVRAFAQRRLAEGSAELVEPVPAYLEQIFNFEFGVCPVGELGDASRFTVNRLSFLYYPSRRNQPAALAALIDSLRLG